MSLAICIRYYLHPATQSLLDIMNIREGSSVLKFSDDNTFSASELSFIVLHVATNRMD